MLFKERSQPSAGFSLQSAKPGLHCANWHSPSLHVALALLNEHLAWHWPQLSCVSVETSQPVEASLSQLAKAPVQLDKAQLPSAKQMPSALGRWHGALGVSQASDVRL